MRDYKIGLVGFVMILSACRAQTEGPPQEGQPPGEEAPSEEAPGTESNEGTTEGESSAGTTGESGEGRVEVVSALMEGHYVTAMSANNAVVRGDMEEFRYHLERLSLHTLPEGTPASWYPYDQQLRQAAAAGAAAMDTVPAAIAVGEIAEACGQCHLGHGLELIYTVQVVPEGSGLEVVMHSHEWAMERMWEGVVDPNADGWETGAAQLRVSEMVANLPQPLQTSDEMRMRETLVRELAAEALGTTNHSARTQLYGRMLMSCSGCHIEAGAFQEE